VWALTEKGRTTRIDDELAVRLLREVDSATGSEAESADRSDASEPQLIGDYREQTLRLLGSLSADGFERLAQRLLRESGFEEVHSPADPAMAASTATAS
jgi:restriction system protein